MFLKRTSFLSNIIFYKKKLIGGLILVAFFLLPTTILASEKITILNNSIVEISNNNLFNLNRLIPSPDPTILTKKISLTDSLSISLEKKELVFHRTTNKIEINLSPNEKIYGISSNSIRLNDFTNQQEIYKGLKNEPALIKEGTHYFQIGHGNLTAPLIISSNGYALYFDVLGKTEFSIDYSLQKITVTSIKNSDLDNCNFYLITGSNLNKIWQKYGQLLGQIPLPPKYIFGLLYSKWWIIKSNEKNTSAQEKLLNTLDLFSSNKLPLDALLLDYDWYKNDFYWRQTYFPNPDNFLTELKKRQLDFIPIRKPRITNIRWKKRIINNNWNLKSTLSHYLNLDFFQANLNKRWYNKNKTELFNKGISAVWLDEADDLLDDFQFSTGNSWQVGNAWYQQWNNELSKLFKADFPKKRFFTLNRAGIPTMSQYGSSFWSGDIESNWHDLSDQISYLINASLLGFPYISFDIGWFLGQPNDELYTRYLQLGTFFPITRLHGYKGTIREPFNFSTKTLKIAQKFINLKYQLLPFRYSLAYHNNIYNQPIITFADNNNLEQFLIGNSLLVQPIVQPGIQEKRVSLPTGQWFNFWQKQTVVPITKKIITEKITLDSIPLYIKAGSILPILPPQDFSNSKNLGTELNLKIYLGEQISNYFELYNDDGTSTNYQQGDFSLTGIRYLKTDYGLNITVNKNNEQFKFDNWHWFIYNSNFKVDKILQNEKEIPFVQTDTALIFHTTNQGLALNFDIIKKNDSSLQANNSNLDSSNKNLISSNKTLTRQNLLTELYFLVDKNPLLKKEFITNNQCSEFNINDLLNEDFINFKKFLNCLLSKKIISGKAETIEKTIIEKMAIPVYFESNLWLGLKNEAVKNLQLALQKLGFYTDQIVGRYWPKTKQAVYDFQKYYNLDKKIGTKHYGIFSRTTRKKLNSLNITLGENIITTIQEETGNYYLNLNQTINRAESLKIISLLWWLTEKGDALPYLDVNKSDWFYPYIIQTSKLFPFLEYNENLFKPSLPLTKVEWEQIKTKLLEKIIVQK